MPLHYGCILIDHDDINPKDFKKKAVGYVTAAQFNPVTGWFDCTFLLTDDKAKEKVERDGYSVSCSFHVKDTGPGGEWHAIKYDEEIADGEFEHLALVTTPRYEDCRIVVNSKKAVIKDNESIARKIQKLWESGDTRQAYEIYLTDENHYNWTYEKFVSEYGRLAQQFARHFREQDESEAAHRSMTWDSKNVNQQEVKMFGIGKKDASKAGKDVDPKDPTKEKWAAKESYVVIDNEKVSVETLLNSIDNSREVKQNEQIEVDGVVHNVKDLVKAYQDKKKKVMDDDKKKSDDDKKCDDEKDEEEKKADDKKKCDDAEEDEDKEKKNTAIGKDNPEPQEIVDKAKQADKKKDGEDEETVEKDKPSVEKKNVKFFKALNSMKDGAEMAHAVAVDTLHNKITRGSDKYGSKKAEK